jgi:acetate kinase
MGTRSGDLDPGIIFHLMKKYRLSPEKLKDMLNEESGLAGISGLGKDFRKLRKEASEDNERAKLAIGMFCYRIKKYIGAYIAAMEGADAIVFSGGIGDNNYIVRELASDMPGLGVKIDKIMNTHILGREGVISTNDSKVQILAIPTDEEKMIAKEVLELIK